MKQGAGYLHTFCPSMPPWGRVPRTNKDVQSLFPTTEAKLYSQSFENKHQEETCRLGSSVLP